MPGMSDGSPSRTKTSPVNVPRSRRMLEHRVLTSFKPGYAVPVLAYPLLREDAATRVDLRLSFEQAETVELLVNAVHARALAYVVPWSAFDRFDGMDHFNRSYMKQGDKDGGAVTPFINTAPFVKANMAILSKLGVHARDNQTINTAYIEAYNEIFNMRCRNRSNDLITTAKRTQFDGTLAPAFWNHQTWAQVVPNFDQASIEGAVPLSFSPGSKAPVTGIGLRTSAIQAAASLTFRQTSLNGSVAAQTVPAWMDNQTAPAAAGQMTAVIAQDPANVGWPGIFAELSSAGATLSLANIELARRTQAFAMIRKQYNGLEDDYIMDLLMSGITVPDQDLRAPILLSDRSTIFGMSKRYSAGEDLTESVTNGGTFLDIRFRTPPIHTGGIVMVIVEVVPEQIFERQNDPYLTITDQALYPEFVRDTLDPEKVDIVQCQDVDIMHSTPTTTFGYTYLNEKWNHSRSRVGGKFYRPNPDGAFDEDRQRLWAVETLNPTLSRDFYLCGTVNLKPFLDTASDCYEVSVAGNSAIDGNTVFGRPLIEASDDYAQILDQAPDVPKVPKSVAMTAQQAALADSADVAAEGGE